MGSNTEEKPWTKLQKMKQRGWEQQKLAKIVSHFGGTNNISPTVWTSDRDPDPLWKRILIDQISGGLDSNLY